MKTSSKKSLSVSSSHIMKIRHGSGLVESRKQIISNVYNEMKVKFLKNVFEATKTAQPDCALITGRQSLLMHKAILSAASPYLQEVFTNHPASLIFVRNVNFENLMDFKSFIYDGNVSISSAQWQGLQKIAKAIKVELPTIPGLPAEDTEEANLIFVASSKFDQMSPGPVQVDNIEIDSIAEDRSSLPDIKVSKGSQPRRRRKKVNKKTLIEVTKTLRTKKTKSQTVRVQLVKSAVSVARRNSVTHSSANSTCRFCSKPLKGKLHARECLENPDRNYVKCPICDLELKPSALQYHKFKFHFGPKAAKK